MLRFTFLFPDYNNPSSAFQFLPSRYDLFAEVKDMKCSANSSEVLATLRKEKPVKWSGLLQSGAKKGTVKLDFSRAVDSDDESDSGDERVVMSPPRPLPRGENVSLTLYMRLSFSSLSHTPCIYVLTQLTVKSI